MFGFLAALTSSLIVYDENRKHGLRKVQLRNRVFGAAAVALPYPWFWGTSLFSSHTGVKQLRYLITGF